MKKHRQIICILIPLAVLAILTFAFLKSYTKTPSSFAVKQASKNFVRIVPDTIEIDRSELKHCCSFNIGDNTKECWLIKKYSCDYCKPYCEQNE